MRETQVQSLGWEDPLEKEMATHSSTLARKIPWTEEPARLQFMGLQRVGHNWATSLSFFIVCTRKSAIGGKKKTGHPVLCPVTLTQAVCIQSWNMQPPPWRVLLRVEKGTRHPGLPPLPPPWHGRLAMSSESWAVGKKKIQYLLYPPERMWDFCLYQKGVWVLFF